jgi:lipoprotein-releasing system permease protein
LNFFFAWRYFKAKKSTNAINIIAWVSVSAILVGTASLIIVLSVFNGLEDLVKSLYSSFYPEIKISASSGKFIQLSSAQIKLIKDNTNIRAYTLVVEEKVLLQYNSIQPAIMKGVDSNYQHVNGVSEKLASGKFDLGTAELPGLVVGVGIENALGLESDRSVTPVTVYVFKKDSLTKTHDPLESLSTGNMAPTGAFVIQQEFDNKYALTNLSFMKSMLALQEDEFSGVEIALKDPAQATETQKLLEKEFGNHYLVRTRYEQNQSLYRVMHMEKWVIYAVLTMILVVAAFNMVGALTMLVLEKQKDIQVLKAMGANNQYVLNIFLSEGILLALLGAGLGIILALIICWMQVRFKLVPLQGESFLISYYPVKLIPGDFILVFLTIFLVALIASWYPARKAAGQAIELRS